MINARSGAERRWQKMCLIYITQLGYIMSLPIFMLSKYEPHTKIYSEVHRVMFSDILLMPIIPTKKYIIIISISIPRRSLLQTPPQGNFFGHTVDAYNTNNQDTSKGICLTILRKW